MAAYFQLGNEMNKTVYSGEDANGAYYSGIHKTTAMTIVAGDTVEIPLCELPIGARLEGIMLQTDLILGVNLTCAFVLRKKSNSIFSQSVSSLTGTASGLPDITLTGGVLIPATKGAGALAGAGATVVAPAVSAGLVNIYSMLFPQAIEGTTIVNGISQARAVLQESYYLGLLLTAGATPTLVANANIQIGVDAEYLGIL